MPLETGTYINSLNAANPPDTDSEAQGAAHLRLVKATIKNTLPNLTGAVTATQTSLNAAAALQPSGAGPVICPAGTTPQGGVVTLKGAPTYKQVSISNNNNTETVQTFDGTTTKIIQTRNLNTGTVSITDPVSSQSITFNPSGGNISAPGAMTAIAHNTGALGTTPVSWIGEIRMWSWDVAHIPTGWHLCDGTSGTVDLRGKFLAGAGAGYEGTENLINTAFAGGPAVVHYIVFIQRIA
jgi:hypothetical protein